jgi:hypothetical protein
MLDVRDHVMKIVKDDGVFRHVKFFKPGTSIYGFSLTTWPGYLAITGDCEDFVFCRLNDMFEFFRGNEINRSYWAEKATAVGRHGGIMDFSDECYEQAVRTRIKDHISGMSLSDAKRVVRDMRLDLFDWGYPSSTAEAIETATGFTCPVTGTKPLEDIWDSRLEDYRYGFVWVLRAIRWGIERYDASKLESTEVSLDRIPAA